MRLHAEPQPARRVRTVKPSGQKSLVLFVPGFPASESETDCVPPVQEFVKAVARRNPGLALHVVSFHYPFQAGRYRWNGVQVHALGGRNSRFPLRLRTWLRAATLFRRLTKAYDVVALHSFWLAECSYVGSRLAGGSAIRHVATIRGQDALPENPYLRRLPLDRMTITSCSFTAADVFGKATGRRVDHVVPTGIDASSLPALDLAANRPLDILGVGSLAPPKDFKSFIEVMSQAAADRPSIRSMILGDGPERASLEALVRERRLTEAVQFAGHVSREQVLHSMRSSKILLHTSLYEGQGYVFLEALASGMRVVCRDVGYTGNGREAYRCSSTGEMAAVLRKLLDAPPVAARDVYIEDIEGTASAFENIYGL